MRTVEPEPLLPGTKFAPSMDSGKPCTVPAITLEGRSVSMSDAVVKVTEAEADFAGSAWLVATTVTALGDGARGGATYSPLALIPKRRPRSRGPRLRSERSR